MNVRNSISDYVPAFISGLALVFSFPTFDFFFLAWVALVPFLLSIYDKRPRQSFAAGFVFGLPYFFGTLYWIYHSVHHYGGVPFGVSIFIVILLCSFLSLYTAIFAVFFTWAVRNTKLPALLIAPAFWVVLEFLRSYIFTGFPWSSVGYSQYTFLTLIQIADITAVYGVSFLVVAVNGALTDLFLLKRRTRDMPLFPLSHTVIGFGFLFISLVAVLVYGHMRLKEERPGENIKVSIIQGSIEQDKKWEPAYQDSVLEIYRDLSLRSESSSPALIVWPETAIPFYFDAHRYYTQQLLAFQSRLGAYLLFGSVLLKEKTDDRYSLSNSAVLLDKTGNVAYTYDKIHLVPFGEYVPLGRILFFIDKLVVGIGDYAQGDRYVRADTPFGSFATLICYEVIFPGMVRKFYSNGGDFIVNITNDAWFGATTGPYQHFSMAVFRAVENRKPLIRAANTGISGFIDSSGRIVSTTGLFQRTFLTGDVKTDRTRSFYSKYGDLFTYVWIVFSTILLANLLGKSRKSLGG
ncbi:MAG: apolipoprotein N-acyltransferase [Nitrospirota bacterium]